MQSVHSVVQAVNVSVEVAVHTLFHQIFKIAFILLLAHMEIISLLTTQLFKLQHLTACKLTMLLCIACTPDRDCASLAPLELAPQAFIQRHTSLIMD